MTKEEKIKEAWDYFGGEVDENGWRLIQSKFINEVKNIDISNCGKYYRPKSLQGIENNNGWKSMDQPDFEENEYVLFLRFVDGEGEPPIFTCVLCDDFEIGYFTHWKRVDYKKPPIY